MAGLAILKHMHNLSDEALCDRWIENPYFQFFYGKEFFRHKLPFDRSSMTHWRQRMGEERLVAQLVGWRHAGVVPRKPAPVIFSGFHQPGRSRA
jgi:hypothetical protein